MSVLAGIGLVYAVMSLITAVAYARDKGAARRGDSRTPEATLHLLELLGGWPGGLLMQRLIHHKNAKAGYQVVFWLIVALHLAGWAFALHRFQGLDGLLSVASSCPCLPAAA